MLRHGKITDRILSGFMTAAMSMAGVALPANDAEASNPKQGQGQQVSKRVGVLDFRNKTEAELKDFVKQQSHSGPVFVITPSPDSQTFYKAIIEGLSRAKANGANVRGIVIAPEGMLGIPRDHWQAYTYGTPIYTSPFSAEPTRYRDSKYYESGGHEASKEYYKFYECLQEKRDCSKPDNDLVMR